MSESALGPLLAREPGLREADLAVVMEPTASALQAGCLGNVNATWTFHGRSGHSARPWLADNAIHRAARGDRRPGRRRAGASGARRPALHRGRVGHADRGRDRPERRPRPLHRARQPALRPRPLGGGGRGAAARLVRPARRARRRLERAERARGDREPARRSACGAAGDLRLEAKQAWTPVAEFAAAGVDAVNFGPGDPRPGPRPRRARRRRGARRRPPHAGALPVPPVNPVLAGLRALPLRPRERGEGRCGRPRGRRHRLRRRRAARADPAVRPRGARRRARGRARLGLPVRGRAARAARRGRRLGRAAASGSRSDPDREIVPTHGSKEVVFSPRPGRVRARRPRRRDDARLPGARARRPLRRRRGRARAAASPPAGGCPTSTRVDWTGVRPAVAELPEQPDRRGGPARALRAGRGARPRARVRRSPPTRPTRELWFDGDAARRRRSQVPDRRGVVVLNTLSKRSSMPGYRSGFVAGDPRRDRRAQALPAQRRRRCRRTFVQRAAIAAWERRGPRRGGPGALPGQARRAAPALRAAGLEPAGGPASFFLWLAWPGRRRRPADDEAARSRCSTPRPRRWRPGRTSAPAARATCASRSCPRPSAAPRRRGGSPPCASA